MPAMKVLIVGGSSNVGSLVLPMRAQRHSLCVFDLKLPLDPGWEYVRGDVRDLASISAVVARSNVMRSRSPSAG
jgi:hypothetical protein